MPLGRERQSHKDQNINETVVQTRMAGNSLKVSLINIPFSGGLDPRGQPAVPLWSR